MDRTRLIPPDPVEAAQTPIEGVDVPATETAVHAEGEASTHQKQNQTHFVENEGLANTSKPEIADVERAEADPAEIARAAQRGRTA